MNYEGGTEEVVGRGEIYYWPSGHTIVVEEAVRMVEFSPHDQMSQVLAHVIGNLQRDPEVTTASLSAHTCRCERAEKLRLSLSCGRLSVGGPAVT